MRSPLQPLYTLSLWLGGLFMVLLLGTILAAILGRQFHFYIRGIDAYAGYCMAAASFLALPGTLAKGEHIRVTLLLGKLKGNARRGLELFCLVLAVIIAGAFAFYSVKLAWWSWKFNDISTMNDATPLWIPQIGMALGAVIFAIAFVEELVLVLMGRELAKAPDELARTE